MTAVAGSVFTAAQFNQTIRDNLAETAPSKATVPGSYFAVSDTNQISQRTPAASTVNVSESTLSTSFVDLTTLGPQVTVNTSTSALILVTAEISNNTASQAGRVGVNISGATTETVDGTYVLRQETNGTAEFNRCTVARLHTTLTPGTNTFRMVYCATGGTAAFNYRNLIVFPY
ncbi:hypothetical protein [Streptomyces sp. S1D4-14]|uniref:hypothetical protein n=1 Tax=Streptomyces sp. S1D4-14 TaxID=2594461 RepID=UPI001163A4AF|nr:hypothetical protein [Streptomyces sp. S1D4-14]QDN64454.1 hypothetical protein FNV66_01070 [Streptomyces sp. S1D4-14]